MDLNSKIAKGKSLLEEGGLSLLYVSNQQKSMGLNELPGSKQKRINQIFFEMLKEPMVYLLLGCGVIYFILGDLQESLMLLAFLFLILLITIIQEKKAQRALEALKDLSSPRALVLRENKKIRIAGKDVVVDDILFVNEGDRVAADGILIFSSPLRTDESLLTGESIAVDKLVGSKLYSGSTVVKGAGILLVEAIGLNTEIGKIGRSIMITKRDFTRLETETNLLIKKIAFVAIFLSLVVVVAYALTRNSWIDGILSGLTLAMAILPNEFPAVLTIFLALGAWRISLIRVLTRKLPAVENLGAVTVLCVDKTGTLTQNIMSIQYIYSNKNFIEIEDIKDNILPEEFHETLEFSILASSKEPFDPMEKAVIKAGEIYLSQTEHLHHNWSLEKQYPLSAELLSITHAWKPDKSGGFVAGAKGAPEAIIDLCHMTNDQKKMIEMEVAKMATLGLRVLGVAKARKDDGPLPINQHDFDFIFSGLIGIADPIRLEVPAAIKECQEAGVRVVMITGDHPITAMSIAKKIALKNVSDVLTGDDLRKLSDKELIVHLKEINIFSRVSPDQKLRIVSLLKSNGEVVAMTGDGVNDVPALKNADIGIAMGARGTDVARESASLVLLDDDFGSIVESIKMGRRVYHNLKSAISYLLAIHIPIAGMSVIPVIFNLPLVLLPAHIAFLHLIIEPTCSIVFEAEPADKNVMKKPPRLPNEPLFARKLLLQSLIEGTSVMIALVLVYLISLKRGGEEFDTRTLVFTTLIVSNVMLVFIRSKNKIATWIALGSFLMLACVLYIPSLRTLFHFSYLHFLDLLICSAVGIISVMILKIFGTSIALYKNS